MDAAKNVIEENIAVSGLSCSGCERAVETSVKKKNGVTAVKADAAKGNVRVTYDPKTVSRKDIESAIEAAGYSVKR